MPLITKTAEPQNCDPAVFYYQPPRNDRKFKGSCDYFAVLELCLCDNGNISAFEENTEISVTHTNQRLVARSTLSTPNDSTGIA